MWCKLGHATAPPETCVAHRVGRVHRPPVFAFGCRVSGRGVHVEGGGSRVSGFGVRVVGGGAHASHCGKLGMFPILKVKGLWISYSHQIEGITREGKQSSSRLIK